MYCGKILRKAIFQFTLGCSWISLLEKIRNRAPPKKIPPKSVRFWRFPHPLYIEGLFRPLHAPLLEAYMAAIQSLSGLHSRRGDENCCVTRIRGKWAFRILTQLQHGPIQLSQLRSTLPPGPRKKLKRYLRELRRASLIVAVDRIDRMSQARYSLSDPLGIAAVNLINALAESTEAALEPEPKHRARLNTWGWVEKQRSRGQRSWVR
jgi:DNA-binding HxlR family transcriptional regulator